MSFTGRHFIAIGHFPLTPTNRAINCHVPIKPLPEKELLRYLEEHPSVEKNGSQLAVNVKVENAEGNEGVDHILIPITIRDGAVQMDVRRSDFSPGNRRTFREVFEIALEICEAFQVRAHVSAGGLEMPRDFDLLDQMVS